MVHLLQEKNKNPEENEEKNELFFNFIAESSENIVQKSKESCKEFFKAIDFSNQNCLSQNARLIRAYEAIKDELDNEKKLRKAREFELGKLQRELREMTKDLNKKKDDMEKIQRKYEELEKAMISLRNSKDDLKELRKNWNISKRIQMKEVDIVKKVGQMLEYKENLIFEVKSELDIDLEKINEKIEFYDKDGDSGEKFEDVEKCLESHFKKMMRNEKSIELKSKNKVFF